MDGYLVRIFSLPNRLPSELFRMSPVLPKKSPMASEVLNKMIFHKDLETKLQPECPESRYILCHKLILGIILSLIYNIK